MLSCDGHDMDATDSAITAAKSDLSRPTLVRCKTVIGKGSPAKAGTSKAHGSPLGDDEIAATRQAIGWPHAPFDMPEQVKTDWLAAGARGTADCDAWQARLEASPQSAQFSQEQTGDISAQTAQAIAGLKAKLAAEPAKVASRVASQMTINHLVETVPNLMGGSADLTGSNNTKADTQDGFSADNYAGSYIYYGVREHGMAAAMNGIALHGGIVPYGGTFLVFTDYCRPSIRLSALMGQRVIYVMTHDSIGLGEDGPTHQPASIWRRCGLFPI